MDDKEKLKTLIKEYLEKARMMQVVTARDNQPWACTVYFAYDDSLNLYWISSTTRRHSEEIRNNEKVAGTIVLPHTPGDKVRGIQFQGVAKELASKEEAIAGMKWYAKRYGMKPERVDAIVGNKDGHVCYKITPTSIVLFDEVNYPDDPRQEFRL
jgi:uncharacterized protein YhbP (UPF0306 family)